MWHSAVGAKARPKVEGSGKRSREVFLSKLYMDNQSALSVARNPEHHGRMKHLDLRHYWLRDIVDSGQIDVLYIPTRDMPADIMTKALGRVKVGEMCAMLGLRKDTS